MRRFHWSTIVGALIAGGLALVFVGPVAVAVVILRCCSDSTRPTAGAWLVLGLILVLVIGVAAALGGMAARALRSAWSAVRRRR